MPLNFARLVAAMSATLMVGCTMLVVAPGADKVRLTVNTADVTTCKAVGNIRLLKSRQGSSTVSLQKNSFAI